MMKLQESLSRCATSTRLEKPSSIFMFYNNATPDSLPIAIGRDTKLKHYPRRGYIIVEQIDKIPSRQPRRGCINICKKFTGQ